MLSAWEQAEFTKFGRQAAAMYAKKLICDTAQVDDTFAYMMNYLDKAVMSASDFDPSKRTVPTNTATINLYEMFNDIRTAVHDEEHLYHEYFRMSAWKTNIPNILRMLGYKVESSNSTNLRNETITLTW